MQATHRDTITRRLFGLIVLSLTVTVASAQLQSPADVTLAIISGTIVDPIGAKIPQATVSIRNDRASYLTVTADNDGHFVIEAARGVYTLRASTGAYGAPERIVNLTAETPTVVKISLSLTSCSVCPTPEPIQLEIPDKALDFLLPLAPLTPYKFPAKNAKRRRI